MTVVGINFGNSYASIAVCTKDGGAECIANEDGERQIACAVSFHGEQVYIGNQAKQQLVKNSANTIVGFRNVLGKAFNEIEKGPSSSAQIVQHPEIPDAPAYCVQILVPSPHPLPSSTPISKATTPAHSIAPTPRGEPSPQERVLTPEEVTSIFLRSLVKSAEDFLGNKVEGAVITVPPFFDDKAKEALERSAKEAGITVLQLVDEVGAVVGATTAESWDLGESDESESLAHDRTQLVVDVGASLTSVYLCSIRQGSAYVLGSTHTDKASASLIDDKLVKFFAADFTKKTKVALPIPSTSSTPLSTQDARAEQKLRLAIEHTKRTLSASPGAATCSVESLKEGMDYTGSVNRMRFDMLVGGVYGEVAKAVLSLLSKAEGEEGGVDASEIDEVVYVGGSGCLPGLDERIFLEVGLRDPESKSTSSPPVRRNGVASGTGGPTDPTGVLARGCAIQAGLVYGLLKAEGKEEEDLLEAFKSGGKGVSEVKALTRTIGVVLPTAQGVDGYVPSLKGIFVPLILRETALPARRAVSFSVGVSTQEEKRRVVLEVWEVKESVRVEKVTVPSDDDDDEPEESIVKHREIAPLALLGVVQLTPKLPVSQPKAQKGTKKGQYPEVKVEVKAVVGIEGDVEVEVKEVSGGEGKEQQQGALERVYVAGLAV